MHMVTKHKVPNSGVCNKYGFFKFGTIFNYILETAAAAQTRISGAEPGDGQEVDFGAKKENWKKTNIDRRTKIRYKTIDEV